MHHVHLADGFEPLDNLTQEISSFLLFKLTSQLTKVVQVTTIAVLHEQVEIVRGLLDVIQGNHVGTLDL